MALQEAVIAIILDKSYENVVLGMGKPGTKFYSDKWHILGEKINSGETDIEALIRCGREEVGLGIHVIRMLAAHISPTGRNARWYECQTPEEKLTPGSDLDDAKWVPKMQVPGELDHETVLLLPEAIKEYFGIS